VELTTSRSQVQRLNRYAKSHKVGTGIFSFTERSGGYVMSYLGRTSLLDITMQYVAH